VIVDSSAILAIFFRESGAEELLSGDCMTYATAALARQPLLCRGGDFRKTDLELT
jgi:uncharacterized protein with PIN domain